MGNKGFTLIDLIVSLLIMALIVTFAFLLISKVNTGSDKYAKKSLVYEEAVNLNNILNRDLLQTKNVRQLSKTELTLNLRNSKLIDYKYAKGILTRNNIVINTRIDLTEFNFTGTTNTGRKLPSDSLMFTYKNETEYIGYLEYNAVLAGKKPLTFCNGITLRP